MRQRRVARLGPVLLVMLLTALGLLPAGHAGVTQPDGRHARATQPDGRHAGGPVVALAVPSGVEVTGSLRPAQPVPARPTRFGLPASASDGFPVGGLRQGWWPLPQWTGLVRAAAGVAVWRGRAPPVWR